MIPWSWFATELLAPPNYFSNKLQLCGFWAQNQTERENKELVNSRTKINQIITIFSLTAEWRENWEIVYA